MTTQPVVPPRLSVTVTFPSCALTVWGELLAATVPRLTGPVGTVMSMVPVVTASVTGVVPL
ncbi:hypothetical protein OG195_42635 (plasmid) [Streptomyces sp. NBC_01362]|uniref:hypothetical protein n=1 Tax=unclassified Streptomyces TaxID=2593676 RepID=UPI002E2FE4A8|nr:hypothetical protein [Streptomyces sp. NBC_01362]